MWRWSSQWQRVPRTQSAFAVVAHIAICTLPNLHSCLCCISALHSFISVQELRLLETVAVDGENMQPGEAESSGLLVL